jgi:hypothetical protein
VGTNNPSFFAANPAGTPAPELIRTSTYIFKGTIKRTHAATLDIVRLNDNTAVVSVDEVLQAPATLSYFVHQEITLQLRQPMRPDERATFFANGWLFGQSIALVEVGHLPANIDSAALLREVTDVRQLVADERLKQVLAEAALVVVGTITAVDTVPEQPPAQPLSEHDPLWRLATLAITSIEKGQSNELALPVAFASSNDVAWAGAPKFHQEQTGIYLLHTSHVTDQRSSAKVGGYVASDPLDYQPLDQLDRVRRLVAELR